MQTVYLGEKLLTTLWVGALWAIGFLAVPTLFATLDDRQLAGMLAGKMFSITSYLGLVCGVLLLLSGVHKSLAPLQDKRLWLIALMLLLVVIGEFILQPVMAELKLTGLTPGSEAASHFDTAHQAATILYSINALCGALLVSMQTRS